MEYELAHNMFRLGLLVLLHTRYYFVPLNLYGPMEIHLDDEWI